MVSGSLGELQLKLRGWGADQSVVEMSQSGELSMTMPLTVLSLAIDGLKPATKYEAAISTRGAWRAGRAVRSWRSRLCVLRRDALLSP